MGWSAVATGQLAGQFYLEKSTFARGEPIFLYFEVSNDGAKAENLDSADPYSFCSGYEIRVLSGSGITPPGDSTPLVLPAQGGRGKGAECSTEAVREIRSDTAPGEDTAD